MLNVVVLQGRLTRDPELRQTTSGKNVCTFTMAVDRDFKGPDGKNMADFIDCVAWERRAEFICRYFGKGDMIAVDGRLQTRKYQDKNGNNRTAIEIVANNVNFAGGKQDSGDTGKTRKPSTDETALDGDDFAIVDDNADLPF